MLNLDKFYELFKLTYFAHEPGKGFVAKVQSPYTLCIDLHVPDDVFGDAVKEHGFGVMAVLGRLIAERVALDIADIYEAQDEPGYIMTEEHFNNLRQIAPEEVDKMYSVFKKRRA